MHAEREKTAREAAHSLDGMRERDRRAHVRKLDQENEAMTTSGPGALHRDEVLADEMQ